MSLEKAILALTDAMIENNDLQKKSLAARGELLKKTEKLEKTVSAKSTKVVDDEEEDEAPKKSKGKKEKPSKKSKDISDDDMRNLVAEFMDYEGSDEDATETELDIREAKVKKLLKKFGVKLATQIDDQDERRELADMMADYLDSFEEPESDDDSDDEEEEEEDDEEEEEAPKKSKSKKSKADDEYADRKGRSSKGSKRK